MRSEGENRKDEEDRREESRGMCFEEVYRERLERRLRESGYNFELEGLRHIKGFSNIKDGYYPVIHSTKRRFSGEKGRSIRVGMIFPFRRRAFFFYKEDISKEGEQFERGAFREEEEFLREEGYEVEFSFIRKPCSVIEDFYKDRGSKRK